MRRTSSFTWRHAVGLVALSCLAAKPGHAQDQGDEGRDTSRPVIEDQAIEAGRTPDLGIGKVGQRQTREEAFANVRPMDRIETRVANRIQNRIQSRIDRNYRPRADTAAPFEVASEQVRRIGSTSRR